MHALAYLFGLCHLLSTKRAFFPLQWPKSDTKLVSIFCLLRLLSDKQNLAIKPSPLRPFILCQVFYTLDLSQYAIGTRANEKDNFYHCINKALQERDPQLLGKLSGQVFAYVVTHAAKDHWVLLHWKLEDLTENLVWVHLP